MKYRAGTRRKASEYEKAIADWWKTHHVFEQSVENRPEDRSYVFYDGPPFITGLPHHGTLLSSIVKDAVPRFWTMRGYRVERRWGWDCHGLPAENFVEKQLGITDRREIGTKWPLEDYIKKARESMVANSEAWRGTIDRIGRWVDFDHAYRTMDKDYMESVWWAFKQLYDAGLIYEGRKVLMYDTKFATPVSKAEVTMDNDAYQHVTDPSAYVKFELLDTPVNRNFLRALNTPGSKNDSPASAKSAEPAGSPQAYFLAWTTTPWTLPANLCLAVNPDLDYGAYRVDGDIFLLATSRAAKLFPGETPLKTLKGKDLVGLRYRPLLDVPDALFDQTLREDPETLREDTYSVLPADFVSADDGTGIVHIAPAYGEDDYALFEKHRLDFVDCLDENGYYLPEMAEKLHALGVKDTDKTGIQVWAGNKFLAKVLEAKGIIYKIEYIQHDYPFNPRSKERIIYRAFPSWFFDIQGQKPLMLEQNENVNWFPDYLKHGRFAKNIEQAPDWNLSRDRFWATAMPVWKGDKGGTIVIGSYAELEQLSGKTLDDYHRPWVDEIEFDKDGEHFRRIEKVLDCWFESGSMPFAELHYPFENREKFEKSYPADFIVEYVGQVRAWFYYVHAVNTALASIGAFGPAAQQNPQKNPYKNVITTGTLAGNDGRKMSKSLGNYTDPNVLMDQYSADSLRFLLLSSPVLSGEDFALTDKDVSDTARKLSMIWNVYDFFTTYAAVENLDSADFDDFGASAQNPLDLWLLSRLSELQTEITDGMESYNLPKALAGVLPFLDDLSNWYVRRSRRRFSKNDDAADKRQAFATLHFALLHLSKLLAPFTPFLAEELYQKISGNDFSAPAITSVSPQASAPTQTSVSVHAKAQTSAQTRTPISAPALTSVHLLDWPTLPPKDDQILVLMSRTRLIITDALALRMQKSDTEPQIKVRQPLSKLTYPGEKLPAFYEQIIADEVNVKSVENGPALTLDKTLTPELEREGFARELIRAIQSARKHAGLSLDDHIRLSLSIDLPTGFEDLVKSEVLADSFSRDENYAFDEIAQLPPQSPQPPQSQTFQPSPASQPSRPSSRTFTISLEKV